jgi:tetratricopeptide (TPR) repeat protein
MVFFLIFSNFLSAQKVTADPVHAVLHSSAHDSVKCRMLVELNEKVNNDIQLLESIANELERICAKNIAQANGKKDASNLFRRFLATAANSRGFIAAMKGDLPLAKKYFMEAMEFRRSTGDYAGLARSYNNLGGICNYMGETETGLKYIKASATMMEVLGNEEGLSTSYLSIGILLLDKGNIREASDYFLHSLQLSEKLKNAKNISMALLRMGQVSEDQKEFDQALTYYGRVKEIAEASNDANSLGSVLNDIGIVYMDRSKREGVREKELIKKYFPQALENFRKSLELRRKMQDRMGIAQSLGNIALIYEELGDPDCNGTEPECLKKGRLKAIGIFSECLAIARENHDKRGESAFLSNLCAANFYCGFDGEALKNGEESLVIAQSLGFPSEIYKSCAILKKVYAKKRDWKKACDTQNLFTVMKDSVDNMSTRNTAIQKTFQYEYHKKEAEIKAIAKIKKEKIEAIAAKEKIKKRIIISAVSGGMVLVCVFAFIIFRRFRITNKQNKLIEEKEHLMFEQNLIIAGQKEELEEKQKEVLDSIRYARRIQLAQIPTEIFIHRSLTRLRTKNTA